MIAVVDYGVGNLFSLTASLNAIGADSVITGSEKALRAADKIILPGVGAFGDAAEKLRGCGLDRVLIEEARKGKEIMGICLGIKHPPRFLICLQRPFIKRDTGKGASADPGISLLFVRPHLPRQDFAARPL